MQNDTNQAWCAVLDMLPCQSDCEQCSCMSAQLQHDNYSLEAGSSTLLDPCHTHEQTLTHLCSPATHSLLTLEAYSNALLRSSMWSSRTLMACALSPNFL